MLHLGNPSLWPYFQRKIDILSSMNLDMDLWISYQERLPLHSSIEKYYSVRWIFTNKGCDVGPFLKFTDLAMKEGKDYKYVLKLHTKSHDFWRSSLCYPLCGNSQCIRECLDLFEGNKNIGMIGGKTCITRTSDFMYCEDLMKSKAKGWKMKLNLDKHHFIAGTMFWMRWKSFLSVLKEHEIDPHVEFEKTEIGKPSEPSHTHAWERFFGIIMKVGKKKIVGAPNREYNRISWTEMNGPVEPEPVIPKLVRKSPSNTKFQIINAILGNRNVTTEVNSLVSNSILMIPKTLNLIQKFGNVTSNAEKTLTIHYQVNDEIFTVVYSESYGFLIQDLVISTYPITS